MPSHKPVLVGPDGPMRVIGTRVDILREATATVEVTFDVPPSARHLELLPSGRFPPILVRYDGKAVDDGTRRRIEL